MSSSSSSAASPGTAAPDLRSGQLRNLLLATLASTAGFWAWTIVGPLSRRYAEQMELSSSQTALLVAMPIFVGSIARVPVGALTDRLGGRVMFTAILALTAPLVLTVLMPLGSGLPAAVSAADSDLGALLAAIVVIGLLDPAVRIQFIATFVLVCLIALACKLFIRNDDAARPAPAPTS